MGLNSITSGEKWRCPASQDSGDRDGTRCWMDVGHIGDHRRLVFTSGTTDGGDGMGRIEWASQFSVLQDLLKEHVETTDREAVNDET